MAKVFMCELFTYHKTCRALSLSHLIQVLYSHPCCSLHSMARDTFSYTTKENYDPNLNRLCSSTDILQKLLFRGETTQNKP